jgi:hypothetical protein
MTRLVPYRGLTKELADVLKKIEDRERREYERDRYGPLKLRIKRQDAKVRAAKRKVKGIKHINPFMAKMLVKNKK